MEFDFSSFMQAVSNPDPEVRDKLIHELLSDEIAGEMAEIAPRLWAVIHERMLAHKDSGLQLNAVINAAVFALATWLAAVSPRNQETADQIATVFVNNLRKAFKMQDEDARGVVSVAHNVGKLKLLQDCNKDLAHILLVNSNVVKAAVEALKK